jgi:hypothetical protein
MTARERKRLQAAAQSWRAAAGRLEGRLPVTAFVQVLNVLRALENCAEEVEEILGAEASAEPEPEAAPAPNPNPS